MELVLELVARAADAVAQRVAALDHEAADDPVEDRAVVEPVGGLLAGRRVRPLALALGELDEVLDRLRRVVREEPDHDVAVVGLQGGVKLLGHDLPSVVFLCLDPILARTLRVPSDRVRSRRSDGRRSGTVSADPWHRVVSTKLLIATYSIRLSHVIAGCPPCSVPRLHSGRHDP